MTKLTTEEVVAKLQKAVQNAFDNPPSVKDQTLWLLRRLLDQVDQAPDTTEFGVLTADFRTGKIDLDSVMAFDKPLTRFFGEYQVDEALLQALTEEEEE